MHPHKSRGAAAKRRSTGALAAVLALGVIGCGFSAPQFARFEDARTPARIDAALSTIEEAQRTADPAPHSPIATTLETPPVVVAPEVAPDADAEGDPDWFDTRSGAAEMLVLFEDPGVPSAAQGAAATAADALQRQADEQWGRVDARLAELEARGVVTILSRFWVTNAVLVSAEPTREVLAALASLPGAVEVLPNATVTGLDQEPMVEVTAPSIAASSTTSVDGAETPVTYGIEKIRAQESWRDFGAQGQGVRVAVLDTGVDATHPDIASRLVGRDLGDPAYPGGWINFDRTGNPVVSKPTDPGSHGTHVAGTVLGGMASGTQIGVAPRAELMAANVLSGNGGGSTARILAALEWAMAPYDGLGRPAGRAADVINMSLGSSGYDTVFITPIRNLRQAGIFPAIAIGNAPCGPTGTSSPGDIYDAFGVGMTNSDDQVAPGSCGAVTAWPGSVSQQYAWPTSFVKPDASAPGVKVFSSMPGGKWGESTGTSMATPHVAGAVALIRSAQAGLSIDQIEAALESTARHPDPELSPDTRYGAGRIDVHAAIASVLGQTGVIGKVVDAASGAPVAGAEVSYGEHGETWRTDAEGRFIARIAPGDYALTVTRFGYEDASAIAVTVPADGFTQQSIPLAAITVGTISGIVVDHVSGTPVADALVGLIGYPIQTTTAADGSYRFTDVPLGEYRLRVDAPGAQIATSDAAPVLAALDTIVNFRLARLPSVLVLGDNAGRTAELLSANGFAAQRSDALPADPAELAAYDAVLWDAPEPPTEAQLNSALAATDATGTGIVWLDLGSDDRSGIAQLAALTGSPAERGAANDRTLTATGYRVVQPHEILQGGTLNPDPLQSGTLLRQNTATGGPKFTAWFSGLRGDVTVIADAVGVRGEGAEQHVETFGSGIAVEQRSTNRHAYLSLHGSSTAVDASTWSSASQQLLVNTALWVAPAAVQAPAPEIIVPVPPVVKPGDGGTPVPTVTPEPTAAPAAQAPARTAPKRSTPKPEQAPPLPVASIGQLTPANAGGVTVRIADGIAHIRVPDAVPGDWYFLHVYPQKTSVGWIRVNDEGELRIDIARLRGGDYRFALTASDGRFVGWVAVTVPGQATVEATTGPPARTAAPVPDESAGAAIVLAPAELLMLSGAALILLAAAGLVLLGLRRAPAPAGAAVAPAAPAEPAPESAP